MTENDNPGDPWKPDLYNEKHSYVWAFGASVVQLLAPQPDERILDIGCGTGQLTAQIAEVGAHVVGMDNSPAMIEEARKQCPQIRFRLGDAHDFQVEEPFDAVFSNAALHWISDPARVVKCIAGALRPGGRLAVEFGGKGNVHNLVNAINSAYSSLFNETISDPWYFPGIIDFGSLLEQQGIEVTQAALIDRPTPLDGDEGLRNWVRMFGRHWLARLEPNQHEEFLARIEDLARPNPSLYRDSVWHADYRRLRVAAKVT